MKDYIKSMDVDKTHDRFTVAILGSFPPLRALSSYCLEFAKAISGLNHVEFISFNRIYPRFLYPGNDFTYDHSFPSMHNSRLRVKRRLTWYNPITWLIEGMCSKARLLHAQWWSLPLIFVYLTISICFRLRGKPVVFTVHNVISHERSMCYIFLSRLLFSMGNHFIVHSERNKRSLIRYFRIPQDKIYRIPHGPLDFHVSGKADRMTSRKLLGLGSDERVILLFGTIRPYKGMETALRAFAEVQKDIPDLRLLIAGNLWMEWNPYQEMIEKMGISNQVLCHLRYIPSSEVHKYFMASDLVILPYTYFDSQSGVGAIALSFRKPLIVTDVGGLPELVFDKRFVVPPDDHIALAKALNECLKDKEILNAMSVESERIAEMMSWSGIAEKTIGIYKEVLNENRGKGH